VKRFRFFPVASGNDPQWRIRAMAIRFYIKRRPRIKHFPAKSKKTSELHSPPLLIDERDLPQMNADGADKILYVLSGKKANYMNPDFTISLSGTLQTADFLGQKTLTSLTQGARNKLSRPASQPVSFVPS
jgi:hypothetical protein